MAFLFATPLIALYFKALVPLKQTTVQQLQFISYLITQNKSSSGHYSALRPIYYLGSHLGLRHYQKNSSALLVLPVYNL